MKLRRVPGGSLLVVLALVALGPIAPASAQAQGAIQNVAGCTGHTLVDGDDNSTGRVPLGFTANFLGQGYSDVYVNQNGNLTFEDPLGVFTPFDLASTDIPIVAPFFADVDTRPIGFGNTQYGQVTVEGRPAFCAQWIDVGYFNGHTDRLNSFQVLLISEENGLGDFDIVFNYDQVQWETGDASGGTGGLGGSSAAVGWSAADGDPDTLDYYIHPGSYQPGFLLDNNQDFGLINYTNNEADFNGRYRFSITNTEPPPPAFRETANVGVVDGTVLVKEKGSGGFVPLDGSRQIPFGSVLDTTDGTVSLTTARDEQGHTQTGQFEDGIFKVLQKKKADGRTDLDLTGGQFGNCHGHEVIRRVIGKASDNLGPAADRRRRGKFRTGGRYSSATVRGTVWGTVDRCDGTLTWVRKGSVKVRDFVKKKNVILRAGKRYLAKAP